jgi:hypothetical protein
VGAMQRTQVRCRVIWCEVSRLGGWALIPEYACAAGDDEAAAVTAPKKRTKAPAATKKQPAAAKRRAK